MDQNEKDTMNWEELEEEMDRYVPVEPKLNRLVFRTRLVQNPNDEDCNAPLEIFKPTYLFNESFLDKRDIHKALEIKC